MDGLCKLSRTGGNLVMRSNSGPHEGRSKKVAAVSECEFAFREE